MYGGANVTGVVDVRVSPFRDDGLPDVVYTAEPPFIWTVFPKAWEMIAAPRVLPTSACAIDGCSSPN